MCEVFDENFPGGIGSPVTPAPTTPVPLNEQEQQCKMNGCPEKVGNGQCNVSTIPYCQCTACV